MHCKSSYCTGSRRIISEKCDSESFSVQTVYRGRTSSCRSILRVSLIFILASFPTEQARCREAGTVHCEEGANAENPDEKPLTPHAHSENHISARNPKPLNHKPRNLSPPPRGLLERSGFLKVKTGAELGCRVTLSIPFQGSFEGPVESAGRCSFKGSCRGSRRVPKGPCAQIVYTLAPKYPYRVYFKAKVYTIWVHGPLGGVFRSA